MPIVSLPDPEPGLFTEAPPAPLLYKCLALDPATGDILLPVQFLTGADAVIQKIRIRFKFFAGEWFLDLRLGVPYYRDILIKNPDPLVVTTIFKQVLTSTPGVKSVDQFQAVIDVPTRTLSVTFMATLDDGSKIVAQDVPFIIGDQ